MREREKKRGRERGQSRIVAVYSLRESHDEEDFTQSTTAFHRVERETDGVSGFPSNR